MNAAVFKYLKEHSNKDPTYKNAAIIMDGMYIKKGIHYNNQLQTAVGYVDHGKLKRHLHRSTVSKLDISCIVFKIQDAHCSFLGSGPTDTTVATEAVFFMAVGLQGYWRLPLGYILVAGVTGQLLGETLSNVIKEMHEVGVAAMSVTFDGLAANIAMANKLGACLNPIDSRFHTSFPHPVTNKPIFIFNDACHVIKLIRTVMAECHISTEQGDVSWSMVAGVHKRQELEGLRMGNKLTRQHINFEKSKMKVRLAAQVLSKSTAASIDLLSQMEEEGYEDPDATVAFLEVTKTQKALLNESKFFSKYKHTYYMFIGSFVLLSHEFILWKK